MSAASQVIIDVYPVSVETLPDDADGQVEYTLSKMVRLAAADASSPEIQRDAQFCLSLGRGNPLEGVHQWIRSHMTFVTDKQLTDPHAGLLRDPNDYFVEAFTRPREVSKMIAATGNAKGDCDDFSMYCAALLACLDVPCAFCTIEASSLQPGEYSHVYCVAYPDGIRIPMDCSHGQIVGWEQMPNHGGRRKEWQVYAGRIGKFEALVGIGLAIALMMLYRIGRGAM